MVRPKLETYPMNTIENEPLALDVRGVAALLGVSARHVWSMNASARMPAPVRLGKRVLWRRDELVEWLAAGAPEREQWEARKRGAA